MSKTAFAPCDHDESRREIKRKTLRFLEEFTPEGQEPNRELLRQAAQMAGKTLPTIRNWWEHRNDVPDLAVGGRVADEREIDAFFAAKGSYARAIQVLKLQGTLDVPHVKTFERAIKRALTNGQIAAAKFGHEGMKAASFAFTNPDGDLCRNDLWEIDTVELPFRVVIPRGSRTVKARVVGIIDGRRVCRAAVLVVGRPVNRGDVLAAIAAAIRGNPDRGPFRGVPRYLRCDNGLDYLSNDVAEAALALGIVLVPTRPYTPEHKGKIERFFGTFQSMLALEVPGSVEGRRDKRGKLLDTNDLFTVAELAAAIEHVVDRYNKDRPHSALQGRTPLEAWNDDPTPIREIPAEDLRWMLLAGDKRKIVRQGIRFENRWFIAPEILGLIGETVDVFYLPSDLRTIEVYRRGKHLCTAVDTRFASGELKADIAKLREYHTRTVAKIERRTNAANRGRQRRLKQTAAEIQQIEQQAVGYAPIADASRIEETPRKPPAQTSDIVRDLMKRTGGPETQHNLIKGRGRINAAWKNTRGRKP